MDHTIRRFGKPILHVHGRVSISKGNWNRGRNARERIGTDPSDPVRGEKIKCAAANIGILAALHQIMGSNPELQLTAKSS